MPVHSKIPIGTFTFSDNPLLTPQDDSQGQYVSAPKIWLELDYQHGRYGKKSISPTLLLLLLLVVVFVVQFQTLYLKTRRRYRSENWHTSRVQYPDVQRPVKMFVNNVVCL